MRIEIGPVSRASARAWLEYATGALEQLRAMEPASLPESALDGFTDLVRRWRRTARAGGPFHWVHEESPERVEYLMKALYTAGVEIERGAARGQMTLRPAAADEFHIVMVRQVLDALGRQSRSSAEFAESLRNDWTIARPD